MNEKELALKRLKAYGRVIAFAEIYMDVTNSSASAALLLSQAVWQQEQTKSPDAWFGLTYEDWYKQTRLSRHQIDTARKVLGPILRAKKMGIPVKNYYQVNVLLLSQKIDKIIMENPDEYSGNRDVESDIGNQFAGKRQTDCGSENSTPESGGSICRKAAIVMPESGNSDAGKRVNVMPESGNPLTIDLRRCTEDVQKRGSRARARGPAASEEAISFVKAFQDRHPWYPRKPDPKQTARELEAAKYLLDNSTQEEVFRLVDRVMAGFRGNRRKVATLRDVWENFAALRIEFSDQSGLSSEASARIAEIETRREKTDAEVLADWDEAVECCRKEGLPDPVPRGYTRTLLEQRNGLQSVGSTGEV